MVSTAPSSDVISERHLRKRLAARVRQQRCRARKREAKMVKVQREVKAPRPSVLHQQVVRGPVLIRSPPRMTMPLMHHPTSPFIMYPRRAPNPYHPPRPGNLWPSHLQQPRSPPIASPPITSIPFHGSSRPLHQEIMTGSALALGMCRTPPANHHVFSPPLNLNIPRVSPVAESTKMVPVLPDLDPLERKEETAIDAMLSLHRSPSK